MYRDEIKKFLEIHQTDTKEMLASDDELGALADILRSKGYKLIAHYYTDYSIQRLAEMSGGMVGDSLEMAKFGSNVAEDTILVAGVKFMGETAKILSPNKRVFMIDGEATCSLDLGCGASVFAEFIAKYPGREIVVYANTSAEVKAMADWVVTSSIALDIVSHLHAQGKKVLFAPDKHLGHFIQQKTSADMVLFDASCVVHEEFSHLKMKELQQKHEGAAFIAHPESRSAVLGLADFVGSTGQLINFAKNTHHQKIIVATEKGIFYKMSQQAPDKTLILAPSGDAIACQACGSCFWMAMNKLDVLRHRLSDDNFFEIVVDSDIIEKARVGLSRMLSFKSS